MHPQACLQDDFAWRVKMTPHMILFPPFSHPRRKGGARRGMSDNEGMWEPSHKKGGLGEEGVLSYSLRLHSQTPPSEMGAN